MKLNVTVTEFDGVVTAKHEDVLRIEVDRTLDVAALAVTHRDGGLSRHLMHNIKDVKVEVVR